MCAPTGPSNQAAKQFAESPNKITVNNYFKQEIFWSLLYKMGLQTLK
jgi:hypothetical protein